MIDEVTALTVVEKDTNNRSYSKIGGGMTLFHYINPHVHVRTCYNTSYYLYIQVRVRGFFVASFQNFLSNLLLILIITEEYFHT